MNVRQYRWVIDMDISSFFDKMSHELLMKVLDRHVEEKWVKMYIRRWLEAPIEDKNGNKRYRNGAGTPQGGVVSPLLANLFLHYAFDKWLIKTYRNLSFVRYADDVIVHCNSQAEAEQVLTAIKRDWQSVSCRLMRKRPKLYTVRMQTERRGLRQYNLIFWVLVFNHAQYLPKKGRCF